MRSPMMFAGIAAAVGPLVAAERLYGSIDWRSWLVPLVLGAVVAVAGAALVTRAKGPTPPPRTASERLASRRAPTSWLWWGAVPWWTVAVALVLNAELDGSPVREHASTVLRKTEGGRARTYIRDFRPGGGEIALRSHDARVRGLHVGQEVTLVVRSGWFGWTRLVEIR